MCRTPCQQYPVCIYRQCKTAAATLCLDMFACHVCACFCSQAFGMPFMFDTTQGKGTEDERAKESGVYKHSIRAARQYMNRKGGFNRALPAEKSGEKYVPD